MAIAAKQLADGQLAAAEAVLYTAPALTTTYVKAITLHNTHAANLNTVIVYMRPSAGTSRIIGRAALSPGDTFYITEARVLDTGDTIRGYATNAAQVDYTIDGAEEV